MIDRVLTRHAPYPANFDVLVSAANRENGWANWSGLATLDAVEEPIVTAVDRLLTRVPWSEACARRARWQTDAESPVLQGVLGTICRS